MNSSASNKLPSLLKPRLAIICIFFVNGYVLGTWALMIPTIQEQLVLGEGLLGIALLSMAVGAVVMMPISGILISYWESRIMVVFNSIGFCLMLSVIIVIPSYLLLIVGLFFFGLLIGSSDVAMNTQAFALEKRYKKNIMSFFHGFFSLGGLAGASIGGVLLTLGVSPSRLGLGTTLVLVLGVLVSSRYFLTKTIDTNNKGPTFVLPGKSLLSLSLLGFLVFFSEGVIMDWSTVYYKKVLATEAGEVVLGYAAFSLMMTIGRFIGGYLIKWFGRAKVTQFGAALAAFGMGLSLLIEHPLVAMVGFGCVGLGLANIAPIIFSTAGQFSENNASHAIAAVATVGYCGFLIGPPMIGFTAEATNLSVALGIVVFFSILVSLLAARVINRPVC